MVFLDFFLIPGSCGTSASLVLLILPRKRNCSHCLRPALYEGDPVPIVLVLREPEVGVHLSSFLWFSGMYILVSVWTGQVQFPSGRKAVGGSELAYRMSRGYSVLSYWTPGGIVGPFSEKEKKRWSYLLGLRKIDRDY